MGTATAEHAGPPMGPTSTPGSAGRATVDIYSDANTKTHTSDK
mgnify:CR=1 FL=1